jgi:hypothetical protein
MNCDGDAPPQVNSQQISKPSQNASSTPAMEENILPSLSSARNTQRKVNFDLVPDSIINNFER